MRFPYLRDYESRYRKTYVAMKVNGSLVPYLVEEVKGTNADPKFVGRMVHASGNLDVDTTTISFLDDNLILNVPKLGMSGSEGTLCYISRRPQQRWKQGFDKQNIRVRDYVRSPNRQFNVYDVFNPCNTPLDVALQKVADSNRGIRIHRYAGLVGTGGQKSSLVYREKVAGTIDGGKLLLPKNMASLKDSFSRLGFDDIDLVEVRTSADIYKKVRDNTYGKPDNVRDVPKLPTTACIKALVGYINPNDLAYTTNATAFLRALSALKDFVYRCRTGSRTNGYMYSVNEDVLTAINIDNADDTMTMSYGRFINMLEGARYNPFSIDNRNLAYINKAVDLLPGDWIESYYIRLDVLENSLGKAGYYATRDQELGDNPREFRLGDLREPQW